MLLADNERLTFILFCSALEVRNEIRKRRLSFIPSYSDYSSFLCVPLAQHREVAILDWTLKSKEVYKEIFRRETNDTVTQMSANVFNKTMVVKRIPLHMPVSAVDCHPCTGDIVCGTMGGMSCVLSS